MLTKSPRSPLRYINEDFSLAYPEQNPCYDPILREKMNDPQNPFRLVWEHSYRFSYNPKHFHPDAHYIPDLSAAINASPSPVFGLLGHTKYGGNHDRYIGEVVQ